MQKRFSSLNDPNDDSQEHELTTFKHFQQFNLFLFSRNSDNVPAFLLHKTSDQTQFSHFHGDYTKFDACIFYAVAREFITKTAGLLCTDNLKYFQAKDRVPLDGQNLILEKTTNGPIRPQKNFSHAVNDICGLLVHTPYIYQDGSEAVCYFVEIPLLDLNMINKVAEDRDIDVQLKYVSFAEIEKKAEDVDEQVVTTSVENPKLHQYITKYIVQGEEVVIREHYAMICCEPRATNYMLVSLHYSAFKKHGESWTFYKAFENEFPTDKELKRFKGVIIPGSRNAAYDTSVDWYKPLFEVIEKIIKVYKQINLLGICFGAQVTAQALGGRVAKMDRSFIRGGELLRVSNAFYELDFVKDAKVDPKKPLVIAESHGDHIVELPEGAILRASSVNTNVEVYTLGKRFIGFQGHPDYNEPWTSGAFHRIHGGSEENYDEFAQEYEREKFPDPLTQKEILQICYKFLKRD